mgnify:CR=1 FL=1
MRNDNRVADERSVAEIAVFHSDAVSRDVALAGLRSGLARAVLASVAGGAGIAVVADLAVQGHFAVLASQRFVTDIQRALVIVIAVQRSHAYALAALADVNYCTHCSVIAIRAVRCWRVGAFSALTNVSRAFIAIIRAFGVVGSVHTSAGRVAGVVSADITVIALDACS